MKYILYLFIAFTIISCNSFEKGKDKVWEPSYFFPFDILQLKFNGDTIKFIDINLIEHTLLPSEYSSCSFPNNDSMILESIPFNLSKKPYYSGLILPNLTQTNFKTNNPSVQVSIPFDSTFRIGKPFYGASFGKYHQITKYLEPYHIVDLYMDKDLPISYFDSVRLHVAPIGNSNFNIISINGNCYFKTTYPWEEELENSIYDSINLPPPPPYGYLSLCELKADTLFKFVDLSNPLDYEKIISFLVRDSKNAVTLLYDETYTVEYVFQPFFKLFHEIYLVRNEYSLKEYQIEFNNLEPQQRKEVRKKYPIRIRLANKKLLEKCN